MSRAIGTEQADRQKTANKTLERRKEILFIRDDLYKYTDSQQKMLY